MKLNLLPKSTRRGGGGGGGPAGAVGIIVFVVMLLVGIGIAAGLWFMGKTAKEKALAEARTEQKRAADALAVAQQAEPIMQSATILDRNLKFANSLQEHNTKYMDLYDTVLDHVPAFCRVTAISADPTGPTDATVTLTGILRTYQEYADTSLALHRIPNVVSVVRSGYTIDEKSVPAASAIDPFGTPLAPGETPLPSGGMERLDALIARAEQEAGNRGFQGVSGYGTESAFKGAMPGSSVVTFVIQIANRPIQVPNPRVTLTSGGAAPGGAPGVPPAAANRPAAAGAG